MSLKVIGVLLVLIVLVAGGHYYLTTNGAATEPALSDSNTEAQQVPTPPDSGANSATTQGAPSSATPAVSGSVDAFSAQIDSEIGATNSAIGSMDADTDASVSSVQSTGNSSNLYDPNNL